MNRHAHGFTLVELVIVIVLLGILAVALIPRDASRGAFDVGSRAEQLAGDIRLAQSLSMTRGQRFCIFVLAQSYELRNNNCTTAVAHPATGTTAAIAMSGVSVTPANSAIEFDTRGRPTTAPALILSSSGETRTVVVSAETGNVRVQ